MKKGGITYVLYREMRTITDTDGIRAVIGRAKIKIAELWLKMVCGPSIWNPV